MAQLNQSWLAHIKAASEMPYQAEIRFLAVEGAAVAVNELHIFVEFIQAVI